MLRKLLIFLFFTITFLYKFSIAENLIGKPYKIVNTEEEDDGDPVVNVCDS